MPVPPLPHRRSDVRADRYRRRIGLGAIPTGKGVPRGAELQRGRSAAVPRVLASWVAGALGILFSLSSLSAQPPSPIPLPGSVFAGPTQLVNQIDAQESDDHADLSVQFACSMRYLTNAPLNRGQSTTITLRLGPDCGGFNRTVTPEFPLVGGGAQWVRSVRLETVVPGEVTLEFTWTHEFEFVMVPTADDMGLRIRLLGVERKPHVYAAPSDAPEGYAVNLDSSQTKFDPAAVQAAAQLLGAPAYVSETDLEGHHWYRLRVGPFTTRAEAERVLHVALERYPRAWLALNDETADLTAVERAGTAALASSGPVDPTLPDAERKKILADARTAMAQHQYPQAVELLTRLLRQPEYPGRAEAQELIGLVRERAGQLAHAKAEYQEYLRRYPNGAAAARIRARLLALSSATEPLQSGGSFGAPAPTHVWSMAGSAAVTYQYGQNQLSNVPSSSSTALNAALIFGDLLVRERGQRYDLTVRADGGYTANFNPNIASSQDRTTAAYLQVDDRQWGWSARAGRQSLATQGNIGLFDGLYAGFQASSKLVLSAAAGFPVYSSYSNFDTQARFATVAAELGPYRQAFIFDAYLFDQANSGLTERRAVGMQMRYSMSGRSAMLLTDYDIYFRQLNALTLIGNASLWHQWVLGFTVDHRRSPLLLLSNALIGQTAETLPQLQTEFTPSQIQQLAIDRTAQSNTYTLSATHPFGERWQLFGYLSALELGGTPASGGVPATPSTGLDKTVSIEMAGSSLLQPSDLHFFGARFDDSPTTSSVTLSWDARFALHGNFRIGPRLSVERLENTGLGGTQMFYLPELRADWTGRWSLFELIAGYQVEQISAQPTSSETRYLYASATYRVRF